MKLCYLVILISAIMFSGISLYAQQSAAELDNILAPSKAKTATENDSINNDIIRVNYSKKNAGLAMLMSGLVPGAGQFYVDKYRISTYIYPIIELAIIGGIVIMNNQGDKKVKEYKKYANGEVVSIDFNGYTYEGTRYRRDFQTAVEDTIKSVKSADIYDNAFFSLDRANSQHFYEDIGKYNKYVFGWADWYMVYGEQGQGQGAASVQITNPNPNPIFAWSNDINDPTHIWIGNRPLSNATGNFVAPNSDLRSEYIQMRQSAEDKYRVANYLSFGIALNHIVSAIDAARVTSNRNRLYLSENKVKMNYYTTLNNGNFTPMLGLRYSF